MGEAALSSRGQLLMGQLQGGLQPVTLPALGRNKSFGPERGPGDPSQRLLQAAPSLPSPVSQEVSSVRRGPGLLRLWPWTVIRTHTHARRRLLGAGGLFGQAGWTRPLKSQGAQWSFMAHLSE